MTETLFRGRLDRPTLAGLGRLMDALAARMERSEVPPRQRYEVLIALDELVSNVLNHREGRERPHVDVRLERREDDALELAIEDDGRAFDPFAREAPATDAPLEAREVGGLGIHLARSLAREVAYRREGDRNRVRLIFRG